MRKNTWKIVAAGVVVIPLAVVTYLSWSAEQNLAAPADEALAALADSQKVQVDYDDWLVMRPAASEPVAGIILYPGAYCDVRGYAPVLREVAAAGYLVVALPMPFNFSIFAPNRASSVPPAFPEIEDWILTGHSMGGAMAGRYASQNADKLAGLILWDAYPPDPNSLADSDLPILHLHRATLDGQPPQKFLDKRFLFPETSDWVPIPGGIHMYFGSFDGGSYVEEWEPLISRDAQQKIIVAAMLNWLSRTVSESQR